MSCPIHGGDPPNIKNWRFCFRMRFWFYMDFRKLVLGEAIRGTGCAKRHHVSHLAQCQCSLFDSSSDVVYLMFWTKKQKNTLHVTGKLGHLMFFHTSSPASHNMWILVSKFKLKSMEQFKTKLLKFSFSSPLPGPCRLTFTWWGCCGLCQRHKPVELAHSCLFCPCVYFCLYGPFTCISFHKFSWQLLEFSLCSSSLNCALLVLSIIYLFMTVSLSPDIIFHGWLGLKHKLT